MKKIVIILMGTIALMSIGSQCAKAATQILETNPSYSISSGGATFMTNKKANNSNAYADMGVDGFSSSTDTRTKYVAYKTVDGTLQKQATKITGFVLYSSNLVNIGNVGSGVWSIINQAFDGSTKFAGWNGSLTYSSR